MKLLCLNPGSGTLRYRVVDLQDDLAIGERGEVDQIKGAGKVADATRRLLTQLDPLSFQGVAVRFVHGGNYCAEPARRVDAPLLEELESFAHLAPLHLPTALGVVRSVCRQSSQPVFAVFDTAFHRTMPEEAWRYPIPFELGRNYRRVGFHGLAHEWVSRRFRERSEDCDHHGSTNKLISLHFGGGASLCAIENGESVWTTMGLTPLDGLMMSTRSGNVDPGLVLALLRDGRSVDDVDEMLNRQSGLQGVSGVSDDTRDLLPAAACGNKQAELALRMYATHVQRAIGAAIACLDGCDAVLISGALVKESPEFRKRLLSGLNFFGIALAEDRNQTEEELTVPTRLSTDEAAVTVAFLPAEEERQMARQVISILDI